MDPHLRATQEWDKKYLPTEKEAYHQSRINGYTFSQIGDSKIGSLYEEELEAIASHPPSVDFKTYRRYKNMSMEQLKTKFPALVDIIGPSLTHEDLFYYATRGWIPEYDSLDYKIDRWNQYMDLSEVGRSLMDMLYGNIKGYVNKRGHPLEKYIIAYDQNMDDEAAIRSIGERIGISIPLGDPAHDTFYELLSQHIENNEPYGYERITRPNRFTTEQLIDQTEKQYYDTVSRRGYLEKESGKELGREKDLESESDNYYPNYLYSDRLGEIRKL